MLSTSELPFDNQRIPALLNCYWLYLKDGVKSVVKRLYFKSKKASDKLSKLPSGVRSLHMKYCISREDAREAKRALAAGTFRSVAWG